MKKKTVIYSLCFLCLTVFGFQASAQTAHKNHSDRNKRSYTGLMNKHDFMNNYTKSWFNPGYKDYEPSEKVVNDIKDKINDYHIKVFMGSWCHDSKREVPKLYKLLDKAGYNEDHLKVYAVNYSKKTADHDEQGLNIVRVPTIIFYDNQGNEINRFVEHAQESFGQDIDKIVNQTGYKDILAD